MASIRNLFDSTRALSRPIEKVITYQNRSDEQLRAEISEYVVTEHIEENFSDLLKKMQAAKQGGSGHEIGVWVSGFYGSGKSSFTKYLGLAFDDRITVDGVPFIQHLQDRLKRQQTKSLLSIVARRFPAAVLMLAAGYLRSGETIFVDSGQHLLDQDRDVIWLAREMEQSR